MTQQINKTTKTKKKTKTESGLHFTKMTGTGNDFLIFDAREKTFPKFDRSLLAQSLCRRSFSVGADGLVFIEKAKTPAAAFKWDFYNADGSSAEMCGNAARCVARYALEQNIADKSATFETLAGLVKTRVHSSGVVEVDMPKPEVFERELDIKKDDCLLRVAYMNTGVPHAVVVNDDWSEENLLELGKYLRHHAAFKNTNGANVTFYEVKGASQIHAATYERGVENVTLACGTGAVAAAVAAVIGGEKSPLEVQVPGGTLFVELGSNLDHATLAGEARFICDGEIRPEALL